MFALFKKEISSFLSSLTGYIVISIFLLSVGLFIWVFPGNFNIPESGVASLEPLFILSPWVFMFLIPAITMRSFAEEKRTGTIELLLTRPITEWQIIMAKYFAGIVLVILSLLPTLIYYYAIYQLGNPAGNIDSGSTLGSYIGLLFLAACFVSIGLFSSSITENQIISFIIAFFISFFCYSGFESLSQLEFFGPFAVVISSIGISDHYTSISRGVVDTRDLVYFTGLTIIFLSLTRFKILSRA